MTRILSSLTLALGLTVMSLGTAIPAPAVAQQFGNSPDAMAARLERLERELQTLNRQVYRGQVPATGSAQAPAAAPENWSGQQEVRLQALESSLRQLTGNVERLRFDLNQLTGRLDRSLADIEFRLESMGSQPPTLAGDEPVVTGTAPSTTRIVRPNAIDNVNNNNAPATAAATRVTAGTTVRTLGVLNADGTAEGALPAGAAPTGVQPGGNASQPLEAASTATTGGQVAAVAPASSEPVSVTLPEGDAQAQYDYAFGLLKRYQFDAAADALTQFLTAHPDDPLAANAQFWLGETHFVNGDYREAVVAFATGYENFPEASKAAENLLKLGMSLGRLGQAEQACLTLDRLTAEYPQAPGSVKQQAAAERRDLECGSG
ncbi:MAG: tol-pal system protein YbgF [Alphaproteobacteria bacterium]|nr:tol-pal system protein YbgF [Alphaproteobacteria bacterium SS10]